MGRKRKPGPRYPSGQLKRSNRPTIAPISGVLWQRITRHGKKLGVDERLCTELGRLNLFGELTVAQTVAGHRVAEIYGRFERFQGMRRTTKSPSYERSYGEAGIPEESMTPEQLAEHEADVREVTAEFRRLVGIPAGYQREAVPGLIPWRLRATIEQLCVEDQAISPALYNDVRDVLTRLSVYWNVSATAKSKGEAIPDIPKIIPVMRPIKARRRKGDRDAWVKALRMVRPDLDDKDLLKIYDTAQALREREIVHEERARAVKR